MMAITVNYGQSKSIHIFSQPKTLASCAIWAHSDTHNRMEHIPPTNEAETHTAEDDCCLLTRGIWPSICVVARSVTKTPPTASLPPRSMLRVMRSIMKSLINLLFVYNLMCVACGASVFLYIKCLVCRGYRAKSFSSYVYAVLFLLVLKSSISIYSLIYRTFIHATNYTTFRLVARFVRSYGMPLWFPFINSSSG